MNFESYKRSAQISMHDIEIQMSVSMTFQLEFLRRCVRARERERERYVSLAYCFWHWIWSFNLSLTHDWLGQTSDICIIWKLIPILTQLETVIVVVYESSDCANPISIVLIFQTQAPTLYYSTWYLSFKYDLYSISILRVLYFFII